MTTAFYFNIHFVVARVVTIHVANEVIAILSLLNSSDLNLLLGATNNYEAVRRQVFLSTGVLHIERVR